MGESSAEAGEPALFYSRKTKPEGSPPVLKFHRQKAMIPRRLRHHQHRPFSLSFPLHPSSFIPPSSLSLPSSHSSESRPAFETSSFTDRRSYFPASSPTNSTTLFCFPCFPSLRLYSSSQPINPLTEVARWDYLHETVHVF